MIWIPIGEGYKLKVFKYGVVLLAIFACLVIGVGLYWFLQDTSVSTENSTSEFSIAHPSVTVPIKEKISSYVKDNKDSLMNAMDEVEAWSEKYYLVFKDERQILGDDGQIVGDRQIVGDIILWPYSREYVSDDSILSFFAENDIIYGVDFPANSDVVVFETDGIGMVMSTAGFRMSPFSTLKKIHFCVNISYTQSVYARISSTLNHHIVELFDACFQPRHSAGPFPMPPFSEPHEND